MYNEYTVTVKMIRELMSQGIYDQRKIFDMIYPLWNGHYSVLRDLIAKEKNR